jgi:prepilin-type processing-associated H-X9-DG protein
VTGYGAAAPPTTSGSLFVSPISGFLCPSDPTASPVNPDFGGYSKNNYVVSEQVTAFAPGLPTALRDITDGLSNTIMIGERDNKDQVAGLAIIYGQPAHSGAAVHGFGLWKINTKYAGPTRSPINLAEDTTCTRFAWSSKHPGGATFAFYDGSAHFLSENIQSTPTGYCSQPNPPENYLYQNLYNKNDGNVLSSDF